MSPPQNDAEISGRDHRFYLENLIIDGDVIDVTNILTEDSLAMT